MTTPEIKDRFAAEPRPALRWWPAAVIVALAAAIWVWIWYFEDVHRQTKNLQTTGLILFTVLLLVLWVLLLSRLRWKIRFVVVGGVVCLISFSAAAMEIRGVTGDLIPVLQWRWQKRTQLPPVEQTPNANTVVLPPLPTANDYPQIYGPNRNGKVTGPALARDWQASPPEMLWRQPIGAAWSGFAVVGMYAVTMEQRGEHELVTCYRLLTGELLWSHADRAHFLTTIAGEGPRTVPTIAGQRVLTLGATGILNCLKLADGKPVWSKDIITENDSSAPEWGVSGSPLVVDGMVIVSAGGKDGRSLVAYDIDTGELLWAGGDDRAHYSSPVLANLAGTPQILIFNGPGVAAHDITSGQVLWTYDWERGHPHITMPVVVPGDGVLVSSGYGTGSQLLHIQHDASDNWSARPIWKSKCLKSKFANVIVRDDDIFGLDDGILVCLELATGDLQWKRGRYGHGQMILVNDLLLILSEKGDLALLEPVPDKHYELTRFAIFSDKTWNPPTLVGEYLLVRNDKEAACYRLPTYGG